MGTDIEQLKSEHHGLEVAIDAELSRPSPDDIRISQMKRQKLRLKDEIARLDPTAA
jgi:hypothetical protein